VWNVLVFIMNSLIFILIGIQMSDVIDKLNRFSVAGLLTLGAVITLVAIAVRFAWVYPVSYLPRWLSGSLHEQESKPRNRELGIISWCGMRGIVSLAAALALPETLPNGADFPARELIIFLTFFVIAATLIGQGLTLGPLIRKLKVGASWSIAEEHQHVRCTMSAAALAAIDAHVAATNSPPEWVEQLRMEVANRVALTASIDIEQTARDELLLDLRRAAIKAERTELIRLWHDNEISDEVMRHQEEILDYQEAQL
jgi:NhaP-type Na+/H+ or K+/H+ antiporter